MDADQVVALVAKDAGFLFVFVEEIGHEGSFLKDGHQESGSHCCESLHVAVILLFSYRPMNETAPDGSHSSMYSTQILSLTLGPQNKWSQYGMGSLLSQPYHHGQKGFVHDILWIIDEPGIIYA